MKSSKLVLILSLLIYVFLPLGNTHAAEYYYFKGTTYNTQHGHTASGSLSSQASSTVVVSASTLNLNGSQKENVNVYARCDVLNGIYGSELCTINEASVRLAASYANGVDLGSKNFIIKMSPAVQGSTVYVPPFSAFIRNYWVGGVLSIIESVYNGDTLNSIEHSETAYATAGRIIFKYPPKSLLDVPTTVAYNQIEGYYSKLGINKGLNGNFAFSYGGSGYLTAKANLEYTLGVEVYPFEYQRFSIRTGDATLTHTIGS